MSTAATPAPAPAKRAALKLPPGSVRALHGLGIVALVCAIILLPARVSSTDPNVIIVNAIPPYLIYLLFIMLGHYFAAHGVTIATREDPSPSPLFLPGGTVRIFIVLALCGCVGYKIYADEEGLLKQFAVSLDHLKEQPFLPLAILGGFFVGVTVSAVIRKINPPAWWQDIEAWFSLIALLGLAISGLIHLVVEPAATEAMPLPIFNAILGGVIAFYFGERS
jgi:hypothetical protein